MLKPWKGHEWGAKKVEQLLDWCKDLKIKELTLFAFSTENFNRPKLEFDYIMKVFKESYIKLKQDARVMKNKIKIRFIGRLHLFPKEIQTLMHEIMEQTKDNAAYIVNFAMGYGGRAEIIDATRKIAAQVKQGTLDVNKINEEIFEDNLYMPDEPDLIIRTGGEQRISGFLLYQGSYAEYYFEKKKWPEFEKEDLIKAVEDYSSRKRRFGK
tara:strand:- start:5447 stop:6079 length:633 start_codon:yes stop_codon:yes gene_type:complete